MEFAIKIDDKRGSGILNTCRGAIVIEAGWSLRTELHWSLRDKTSDVTSCATTGWPTQRPSRNRRQIC